MTQTEAEQQAATTKHEAEIASMKAQAAALRTGIASRDGLLSLATTLDSCPALTPDVRAAMDDLMKATSAQDMDGRCTKALGPLTERATTLGCKVE